MKGAQAISTRRAYGVQRICRVWGRARSSVYARRQASRDCARGHARRQASRDCARGHRRGPVGAAPDDVLVGHIRRVLEASLFGVKYFCRSTSTILAGFGRLLVRRRTVRWALLRVLKTQKTKRRERPLGDVHGVR